MKHKFGFLFVQVSVLAVLLGLAPQADAVPIAVAGSLQTQSVCGLFPKIHLPKVNLGKGAKALLYPVTKTTINGGKTAISGGKAVVNGGSMAVKSAQKGVEIYETGRAISSKAGGIPGIPVLK